MVRRQPLPTLLDLLSDCARGQGRTVLVSGPMAVGKTAVLSAFVRQVDGEQAVTVRTTGRTQDSSTPLGVVSRLLRDPDLNGNPDVSDEWGARTAELLDDLAISAADDLARSVAAALLDLARAVPRPLVVVVDDAHFADAASLRCLAAIAHRPHHARLLLVLATTEGPYRPNPDVLAGLPLEPTLRRIRIDVLSEAGVEATLTQALGAPVAARLAAGVHGISGGNPRLVRSLIEDYQAALPACRRLAVGPATAHAMRALVARCNEPVRRMVQGLAVLGSAASATSPGAVVAATPTPFAATPAPSAAASDVRAAASDLGVADMSVASVMSVAAQLVGLDSQSAAQAVTALNRSGVLDRSRFRHSALRQAVLAGIEEPGRAVLHAGAAELLHRADGPVTAVADHLVAAGQVDGSWVAPTLVDAAAQALADGATVRAVGYLERAYRISPDERQRALNQARLAEARWRLSPVAAASHLDDLITAVHDGHLTGLPALGVATSLTWFGRAAEAWTVLDRVTASSTSIGEPTPTLVKACRRTLTTFLPASATSRPGERVGAGLPLSAVEHLLRETRLDGRSFPLLISAIATLICYERFDAATRWCETFRKDATDQGAVTWQAAFTGVRAVVALQQGDLVDAERRATEALSSLQASEWGVVVGLPLGVLVQAATAAGRIEDASAHLDTAVPPALCDGSIGLFYSLARGNWHLARGSAAAALRDFQSVADRCRQWQLDRPALLPWRVQAALAHLRLGEIPVARDLLTEHLRSIPPGQSGAIGSSLRVLARCVEPRRRPHLLGQAVQELQNSGRRLELALALADLGEVLDDVGQPQRAHAIQRRARQIAKDCGITTPRSGGPTGHRTDGGPAVPGLTALSEAELRVATMAADGLRNQQIAHQLRITVSTVEQHLTRVYSKLKVSRRTALRPELDRRGLVDSVRGS